MRNRHNPPKTFAPFWLDTTDINDAWFRALWTVMSRGRDYRVEKGSYAGQIRRQLDYVTLIIRYPGTRPLHPTMPEASSIPPPADEAYIEKYFQSLIHPDVADNEQYTYGERIANQLDFVIESLKANPNCNQIIFQVAKPDDYQLSDPPCLRHIDVKFIGGRVVFYPYFRSWDAWNGLPVNLSGIRLLQEVVCSESGRQPDGIVAASAGVHLYDHCFDLAGARLGWE